MKNRIALLLCLFTNLAFADTCPFIHQFTPGLPPGGWSLLTPAVYPGKHYHFVSAIHSFNKTYYGLQVICLYACGPDEVNCSPFTLLSNATYRAHHTNTAPWNVTPTISDTFVCSPADNNPLQCIFTNEGYIQ